MVRPVLHYIRVFALILLTCAVACQGQITLAPSNVPIETKPWELLCILDNPIQVSVIIKDPSGASAGFCEPSGIFPASCTPTAGYTFAINETSKTVSMIKILSSSDNGTWTCQHSSDFATYQLVSTIEMNYPQGEATYFKAVMSAAVGDEIKTDTNDSFEFHFGCLSTTVTFVWKFVATTGSWDDTKNAISTALTCSTNQGYQSVKQTKEILTFLTEGEYKLMVVVFVDSYRNLPPLAEHIFNVTFVKSLTPTATSLKSSYKPKITTDFAFHTSAFQLDTERSTISSFNCNRTDTSLIISESKTTKTDLLVDIYTLSDTISFTASEITVELLSLHEMTATSGLPASNLISKTSLISINNTQYENQFYSSAFNLEYKTHTEVNNEDAQSYVSWNIKSTFTLPSSTLSYVNIHTDNQLPQFPSTISGTQIKSNAADLTSEYVVSTFSVKKNYWRYNAK